MRISNFDEDLMRSLFQVTYIFVLMFFYKAHTWGQYPFTNIHIISINIRPQKHAVILQFFFIGKTNIKFLLTILKLKSKSQIFRTSFLKSRLIHLVLMHFQTNGWMLYFSVVKSYYLCIKFKQTICCTICIIAAWSDLKEFQTKFQNVLASQYNVTIRIYDCCFVIIIMMMIIIII